MKLAAKYDIEAPVDFVYRELTDYDTWERMAMRRGAEVTRIDPQGRPGASAQWQIAFDMRGKLRNLSIRIARATPTSRLAVAVTSSLFDGDIVLELLDLTPLRTRIDVKTEIRPKTLVARIYLQTLRLARKKVERSFSQRVAQLAVEMEDRYRRLTSRPPSR